MEKVKKIVLIGASGFVGSALLNEALNRDFEVTAVAVSYTHLTLPTKLEV